MSKTAYFNAQNERIEVTPFELIGLIRTGVITPTTLVESNGQSHQAGHYPSLAKVFAQLDSEKTSWNPEPAAFVDPAKTSHRSAAAPSVSDRNDVDPTEGLTLVDDGAVNLGKSEAKENDPFAVQADAASTRDDGESVRQRSASNKAREGVCPVCGAEVGNFAFCPHCGTKQEKKEERKLKYCPYCGVKVNGEKCCPTCGRSLEIDVNGAHANVGGYASGAQGVQGGPGTDLATLFNRTLAAFKCCWSKAFVLEGRASKSEFWLFFLANVAISVLSSIVSLGVLTIVYFAVVWIPTITSTVRRLHDAGKTGAWGWLYLLPGGGIVLLVMCAICDQTPGPNPYGPIPEEF